jgi:hypothetical protein
VSDEQMILRSSAAVICFVIGAIGTYLFHFPDIKAVSEVNRNFSSALQAKDEIGLRNVLGDEIYIYNDGSKKAHISSREELIHHIIKLNLELLLPIEQEYVSVNVSGDDANVSFIQFEKAKISGKPIDRISYCTLGYKRDDGQWRLVSLRSLLIGISEQ